MRRVWAWLAGIWQAIQIWWKLREERQQKKAIEYGQKEAEAAKQYEDLQQLKETEQEKIKRWKDEHLFL